MLPLPLINPHRTVVLSLIDAVIASGEALGPGLMRAKPSAPEVTPTIDVIAQHLEKGGDLGPVLLEQRILTKAEAAVIQHAEETGNRQALLQALSWQQDGLHGRGRAVARWPLTALVVFCVSILCGTLGLGYVTDYGYLTILKNMGIRVAPFTQAVSGGDNVSLLLGIIALAGTVWGFWKIIGAIPGFLAARHGRPSGFVFRLLRPLIYVAGWLSRIWAPSCIQAYYRLQMVRSLRLATAQRFKGDLSWRDHWDQWWFTARIGAGHNWRDDLQEAAEDPTPVFVEMGVLCLGNDGRIDWGLSEWAAAEAMRSRLPYSEALLGAMNLLIFVSGVFMGVMGILLPLIEIINQLGF